MRYTDTDALVVLDNLSNSKKFKSFKNIEKVSIDVHSYFPITGSVEIQSGSIDFTPDNPSYNIDWDWDVNPEGPPKDDEEIFADFFEEMFLTNNRRHLDQYLLPNQYNTLYEDSYIFSKKDFLDKNKKKIFKKIKLLYFYKIGQEFLYFIKNKKEASSLKIPDSIDTKNVELLYISEGHTVDIFREITPLKFPNLKKLVIDTNIVKGGKFPKFEKLEEIYINSHSTKIKFSFENLKNLKKLVIDGSNSTNCQSLKNLSLLNEIHLEELKNKDLNDLKCLKNTSDISIEPFNTNIGKKKVKEILKSENFKFLSNLKNLKVLRLALPFDFPPRVSHNFDIIKLVNNIPKNLEVIYIRIGFLIKDVKKAELLFKSIITRLVNLKKLNINIQTDPKTKMNVDFKMLKKLKKLESINIEYFGDMEPKYENINTLSNFKNLNNIVIPPEKFSDKNLISLYKSVGSGLQIYDDMIGDLLKQRKISKKKLV